MEQRGNALRIAIRFWNYGKLNCLTFIAYFEKQITKLFGKPKWRQCAVGSSFSQVSVPQDGHKEKLSCLLWESLSIEKKLFNEKDIIHLSWSFTFKTPKPIYQLDKPFIIFERSC